MCGNFGIKTRDVETVDTVNAAGVGTQSIAFTSGGQQTSCFKQSTTPLVVVRWGHHVR